MAEVTGDLGGQPIELNNAATEATLKQLLAAMTAMARSSGKDSKFQQNLDKELKKLADEAKKAAAEQAKLTKEQQDEIKRAKELAKLEEEAISRERDATKAAAVRDAAEKNLTSSIKKVGQELVGLLVGASRLAGTMASVGDSVKSAGQALDSIPLVGSFMAKTLGPIADATERVYDSFKKVSSVGATFGGSMTSMIKSASGMGLTIDQFSNLIAQNSENLMNFGGTTSEGAKRVSQLGKAMRSSGVSDQLLRMGYSTEDINNNLAAYSGMMSRSGQSQNMTTRQLIDGSVDYMKELDMLAQVTGKSRAEKQKELEALQRDAQFRLMMRKLGPEQQAAARKLIASVPETQKNVVKDIIAQRGIFTKEAVEFSVMQPQAARAYLDAANILNKGGQMTDQAINQTNNARIREARSSLDRNDTLLRVNKEWNNTTMGMVDAAAQQEDALLNAAASQNDSIAGGAQVEDLAKLKQDIAIAGNNFTQALLETTAGMRALKDAFKMLEEFTKKIVIPTQGFTAQLLENVVKVFNDIFGPVVGGLLLALIPLMGAIAATILAFKTLSKSIVAQSLLNKITTPKTSGPTPGSLADWKKGPTAVATGAGEAAGKKGIMATIENIMSKMGSVFGRIGPMFSRFGGALLRVGGLLVRFAGPIGLAIGVVTALYQGFKFLSDVDWDSVGDSLTGSFNKVTDFLEDTFIPVFDIFKDLFNDLVMTPLTNFGNYLSDTFKPVFESIGTAFTEFKDYLSGIFKPIFESIGNFFKDVWLSTIQTVNDAMNSVSTAFTDMTDYINNTVSTAFKWLGDKVGIVVSFFSDLGTKMANFVRGFDSWTSIFTYLGFIFKDLSLTMREFGMSLKDKFSFLPGITAPTQSERDALERERGELRDARSKAELERQQVADRRNEEAAQKQRERDNQRKMRDDSLAKRKEDREKSALEKKAGDEKKALEEKQQAEKQAEQQSADGTTAQQPKIDFSNPIRMLESWRKQRAGTGTPAQPPVEQNNNAATGRPSSSSTGTNKVSIKNSAGELVEERSGGNINWRNNNPGNIRYGQFAVSMGAIGENGGFAVFPTEEIGRKAADTLLKGKNYAELSAAQAIS